MASRTQKIAYLIFALMFLAIMAILNSSILTLAVSANEQAISSVSSYDPVLAIYDRTEVLGATVAKAASRPGRVGENIDGVFVLCPGAPTTDGVITPFTDASPYTAASYGASGLPAVNEKAVFDSYLVYNKNGVAKYVLFIQQAPGSTPTTWNDGVGGTSISYAAFIDVITSSYIAGRRDMVISGFNPLGYI